MKSNVTNKVKRNLVFSMLLGDGCLSYIFNSSKKSKGKVSTAQLALFHGEAQRDYLEWKLELLRNAFDRPLKLRTYKGASGQVGYQGGMCAKRFRVWRKWVYPYHTKNISRILPWISDPILATAVWFMDDGACCSTQLRLWTCSSSEETQKDIIKWFEINWQVTPVLKYHVSNRPDNFSPGKPQAYLIFNTADSQRIYEKIRPIISQIPSMIHKFRTIERRFLQPPLGK